MLTTANYPYPRPHEHTPRCNDFLRVEDPHSINYRINVGIRVGGELVRHALLTDSCEVSWFVLLGWKRLVPALSFNILV